MKGWVGVVGWSSADGLPTCGHPSAEGRAQDRVSSPAKDRRSANCATQPMMMMIIIIMNCTHHLGNETSTWSRVLFVHVTSVLCCSVLSSVIVLASCQACTPDNENYYRQHYGDQLHVIDTLSTDERAVSAAVNSRC